ncbi:sulfatase [Micromonospora pisi]|uniref:sulfatase n=1 Tax=Micromonospora pisi TaxID=589240 RepID=UPI001FECA9C1|nr:sulfatase [Micromonospora pisi]
MATAVGTVLSFLFVLFALIAPNDVNRFTPGAFVRIPLEALLGAALVLGLPAGVRRPVVAVVGAVLGLLLVLKIIDMGFFMVLARPFDPVLDWTFITAGVDFLTESIGRAGAIGAVVGAVVLVVAVLVLTILSVLRLARVVVAHRKTTTRTVVVLTMAWVSCAVLGAHIVPGVPIAADSAAMLAYDHSQQVRAGLRDEEVFAAQAADDIFRDTPGDQLLTGLRGKDVIISFVESYGRVAIEDPELAPQVDAVLDEGTRRLRAAGFASRSAFLTSPTAGGGSWLAHATLLSGVWADNQQRYNNLVTSDRLTLNGTFRRAGWRTTLVMPALTQAWPEADFFASDRVYGVDDLGYQGPKFSFAPMPDQYTLSAFQRLERAQPDRAPVMAEIPLVSSHAPWTPIPQLVDWNDVGDGSIFGPMAKGADVADAGRGDSSRVRTQYRRSIEYSLNTLISYVETYGDDNLVLVFLGDHQPAPVVTGAGAGRDVPITIVAHDPAVLERISGWGWQDGLNPDPKAPVWSMDAFRDKFLKAF